MVMVFQRLTRLTLAAWLVAWLGWFATGVERDDGWLGSVGSFGAAGCFAAEKPSEFNPFAPKLDGPTVRPPSSSPGTSPSGPKAVDSTVEPPPTINPFGPTPSEREDSTPGYVELSDGTIHVGMVYLTRDKRLQVYDEQLQRQREIPLRVVGRIECKVLKEWMEKEWKFKDAASATKMYTGREYPAREYVHVITLQDGRTIEGPLSGVVYVQERLEASAPGGYRPVAPAQKFLLHKRDKGEFGDDLKKLVYVKLIKLGEEAYQEGKKKAAQRRPAPR